MTLAAFFVGQLRDQPALFASLILPFQIACAVTAIATGTTYSFLNRSRSKIRAYAGGLSILVGLALFLPILFITGEVVDRVRYGTFEFDNVAEIEDPHIHLPASAQKITRYKNSAGHEARFRVEQSALTEWMTSVAETRRRRFGVPAPFREQGAGQLFHQRPGAFAIQFSQTGWMMPPDVIWYRGWRAANGAGFDVWYSPGSREGFVSAAYW